MTATVESTAAGEGGAAGPSHFRYPGSPPFGDDELNRTLFQGRADEAQNVLHSILSSDLFLLYSVSGLGKSSLLNAGVLHSLRQSDRWPVLLRLNDPSSDLIADIARQIQHAAAGSDVELLGAPNAEGATDATTVEDLLGDPGTFTARGEAGSRITLWDLLASIEVWRDNELQQPVLVFDQFEELFTLGWDPEVRQGFIQDLGEVVRGHRRPGRNRDSPGAVAPDVKFVLVIREDALGELEALAQEIPQVMRNRFRLDPLSDDQARAAVTAPGLVEDERLQSPRFSYTDAALDTLLGFLGRTADAGTGAAIGNTRAGIDPSQLQIICQFIERETVRAKAGGLAPGEVVEIDEADLGGTDGLEQILGTFYRRSVEQFPPAARPAIRELCETGLINADGRRLSLEEGDIEARYGVDRTTLEKLVDERLMRAEPRVGSLYYEIAHDTLVGPILEDRDERLAARRKRRNRVVLAVLVALAVVVAAVALLSGEGDEAVALGVGESQSGTVEAGGEWVLYTIDADAEDALVISVEPSEDIDPAVEMRTPDGVTRIQDELGVGGTETMVIPPVPEGDPSRQIRVTTFDSTTGDFEVQAASTPVTVLEPGASITRALQTSEPVAVFAVEVDEVDRVTSVTPVAPDQAPRGTDATEQGGSSKLLDTRVETIDPAGNSASVNDGSVGREETVVLSAEGTNHLVVSSVDASAGAFRIQDIQTEVGSAVMTERMMPGVPRPGQVVEGLEQTFTVEGSEDLPTGIMVQPVDSLDPVLVVTGPDGETIRVDDLLVGAPEYVLLGPGSGTYNVVVEGFDGSEGQFELETQLVEPIPLSVSASEPAVAYGRGPTTYLVETPDPESLTVVTMQPGPSSDVVAQQLIGGTFTYTTAYLGDVAQLILSGAVGDAHLITVIPSDNFSVAVTLFPVQPQPIAPGETLTAEQASAFTTEVTGDEVLEFTADPGDGAGVVVDVIEPGGDLLAAGESLEVGGVVSVDVGQSGPGKYQIVVTPMFSGQGSYTASLSPG